VWTFLVGTGKSKQGRDGGGQDHRYKYSFSFGNYNSTSKGRGRTQKERTSTIPYVGTVETLHRGNLQHQNRQKPGTGAITERSVNKRKKGIKKKSEGHLGFAAKKGIRQRNARQENWPGGADGGRGRKQSRASPSWGQTLPVIPGNPMEAQIRGIAATRGQGVEKKGSEK